MPLLLDLDNTLFNSVTAYNYAISKIADTWQKNGHGSKKEFMELYDKHRKKTKSVLAEHTSNRLRLIYFKQLIEEKYGRVKPELGLELDRQYYKFFKESVEREQKKNEKNFKKLFVVLKSISEVDKIVLVTNETLRTQLLKLSFFFPKNIPVKLVTSEEVGIEKPNISIFKRALEVAEANPEDCLMIGDSLKDDIGGATNAGIEGIFLTSMFGKVKTLTKKKLSNKDYFETGNVVAALEYYQREYIILAALA